MDKGVFYDSLRVGEERVIEYEMKPFEERTSVIENIELEDAEVSLPESLEFVARLPSAEPPPPGTVCADVVYADARPAVGVMLGLAVPPDGPVDERATGDDGRVCWEGFDEFLFGDLSLQSPAVAALGQPRSRYVSTEANYRLFVIKRPT
jgi:hypothetical protein